MEDISKLFTFEPGSGKKDFNTIVKYANMFWYSCDILQAGSTSGFSTDDPERHNKKVQEAFQHTNMHLKGLLVQVCFSFSIDTNFYSLMFLSAVRYNGPVSGE